MNYVHTSGQQLNIVRRRLLLELMLGIKISIFGKKRCVSRLRLKTPY